MGIKSKGVIIRTISRSFQHSLGHPTLAGKGICKFSC